MPAALAADARAVLHLRAQPPCRLACLSDLDRCERVAVSPFASASFASGVPVQYHALGGESIWPLLRVRLLSIVPVLAVAARSVLDA